MPRLLGIFFAFAAIMCALAAWSLFAPNGPAASMWAFKPEEFRRMLAMGPAVSFGFLLLAMIMAITSTGCFAARAWGWRLAIALIGINGAADAARALVGESLEGVVGAVIASAILWALLRPRVRNAFRD